MEYIHGDTLADVIQQRTYLTLERKLDLMDALFGGLHYAHRKHIVHRDVKPANMMIDDDGGLQGSGFWHRAGSDGARRRDPD